MSNVNMTFNDGTYESLENWIENGAIDIGGRNMVGYLNTYRKHRMESKGNCVANMPPYPRLAYSQKPCSVLYRDRKSSILQLNYRSGDRWQSRLF